MTVVSYLTFDQFWLLYYSWFDIKVSFSVHKFNKDYLSIHECPGSWGNRFQEISGIIRVSLFLVVSCKTRFWGCWDELDTFHLFLFFLIHYSFYVLFFYCFHFCIKIYFGKSCQNGHKISEIEQNEPRALNEPKKRDTCTYLWFLARVFIFCIFLF